MTRLEWFFAGLVALLAGLALGQTAAGYAVVGLLWAIIAALVLLLAWEARR